MGLPAPVLEALSDFAQSASSKAESTAEPSARDTWIAALNRHVEGVVRLERQASKVRNALECFMSPFSSKTEGREGDIELDEAITDLAGWETSLKENFLPSLETLKQIREGSFSLPGTTSGERAKAISAADRHAKAIAGILELLKDARWQLIALRAESEDPGDAPVFDDPEDLLRYLQAMAK
ncbi:MAG TPA: hypothetical protein VKK31_02405 [Thermoanaerobaculia bacterium]|nr:hypothetical protein [Thermoanaerobaculia bacterium]